MATDRACFYIMQPTVDGHRTIALWYVDNERDLLQRLEERLPLLRADQSLIAMNEIALQMLLRASTRGK